MTNEAYKDWYVQGLQAMKSATQEGISDPSNTANSVQSSELKTLLTQSSEILHKHAQNIAQLLENAGGTSGSTPNAIIEGIRTGSGHMIQAAKDPDVREASIIAASQITVHYFIAAYGTLASTAKHLGLDDEAAMLKQMSDEMKTGDERLTDIAKSSVNKQAQSAS